MPRRSSSCSRSIPVHENTYKCEGRTNPGKLPLIVIRNPGQFVPDKSHRASAISTTSLILGLRLQGRAPPPPTALPPFYFASGPIPENGKHAAPRVANRPYSIGAPCVLERSRAIDRDDTSRSTTPTDETPGPVARKRIRPLIMLISHFLTQDIVCVCKAKGALLFMRIHAYGTHARRVRPGRSPLAL